jgi:hypothetical protein
VAALLLLEALLQRLHQLLPAAERLDQFLFIVGEQQFRLPSQPFLR